jgi:hypothetical protein
LSWLTPTELHIGNPGQISDRMNILDECVCGVR